MKALIDTNVLLDVLLLRSPWDVDAKAVWDASDAASFEGSISALSLPIVFYVARKVVGLEKAHAAMTAARSFCHHSHRPLDAGGGGRAPRQ